VTIKENGMNIKDNQNSEMENTPLAHGLADQTKPAVDESRRHFTKSGLAVSGVLLTLASRPVLGAVQCQSPSGFISGNVSATGTPQECSGLSPGYWKNHPEAWPSPYKAGTCSAGCGQASNWTNVDATMFVAAFNCSNHGLIYAPYTMFEVISSGGGSVDPQELGAHIIAALLNARKLLTPVLTEPQVINMFNEWNLNGYFEPTAGVKWYGEDIVEYIISTFDD
jgi:hypothetical protein